MSDKKYVLSKAELVMMGRVCVINNLEELEAVIDYILKTLDFTETGKGVIDMMKKHGSEKNEYKHIACTKFDGMVLINIVAYNPENDGPEYDLTKSDGVFGYCYNANAPYCSEWGYSAFERDQEGIARRVW